MAVKAVGHVGNIGWEGENTFRADVSAVGFSVETVDIGFSMSISKTVTEAGMEADIKEAIKQKLIDEYGFTFGPTDSVRLIGATI